MSASEYASSQVALSGFHVSRPSTTRTQLDVVLAPAQLGEHPADVVAKIALHFQDQREVAVARRSGFVACQLRNWRANGCIHADVLPDPTAPTIATPV